MNLPVNRPTRRALSIQDMDEELVIALTNADYGHLPSRWDDPRPNLFDTLAAENVQRDAASHYRRQAYKLRVQKWVTGLCVAAATFAVVWFGGIELIGLVK